MSRHLTAVGSVELGPVPDAAGVLCPYTEAYPGVSAEDWDPYRALYPELFVEDGWRLPCLSYLLRSDGQEATLLADVVPHAGLLERPEWVFALDEDSSANAPTRAALVEDLKRRDGLVICGHYPGSGIGRLHEREGRLVWEEARW